MTRKYWFFPTPADSVGAFAHDTGFSGALAPDTHPTGRPGLSVVIPPSVPDGQGARVTISHPGKVTLSLRGTLWFRGDVAGLEVDDVALPDADSFKPCPREYAGNMCGTRVSGLRPLTGAKDPTMVVSWVYDGYTASEQDTVRQNWAANGLPDVLLSWPDSRNGGQSPEQFGQTCRTLRTQGFYPCVMLLSKDYDRVSGGERLTMVDLPALQARLSQILPFLTKNGSRICVGWELSLWINPDLLQALIDWIAPQVTPWGGKLYVHFQQGYASWQGNAPDGSELTFADFWAKNVGKLTGVLHQRDLGWSEDDYQSRLTDVLQRFAGQFFCPADSGFGHPFDCVALEITAQPQYNGDCSEAEGNRWGRVALSTPPVHGPLGPVSIMGSGNGR